MTAQPTDAQIVALALTEARTRLAYGRAYDDHSREIGDVADTYAAWDEARDELRAAVLLRLEQETR